MALNRENIVKPNVAANLNATRSNNLFVNVPDNASVRYRFLPTVHPEGIIWYPSANHFKLKEAAEEAGEQDRGIAVACNDIHGTGDCYLCRLNVTLKKFGDKQEKAIGKGIYANPRYNAQVLVGEMDAAGEVTYFGPRILGLPKGASEDVSQLIKTMDMMRQTSFLDVEKGQDVIITTTGSGLKKRYKIDRSGEPANLDEVYPTWEKVFIEDMEDALGLRRLTNEEMKAAAQYTFGDQLDWEELAEHGL